MTTGVRPVIGFVGMTHLGLVSAAALAGNGFQVIGYDPDAVLIARLNAGDLPVREPGLDALIADQRALLSFSDDTARLSVCDVVYISIDVPTDDWGRSDLAPVRKLIHKALEGMKRSAILVVLCQVPPGFTATVDWPRNQLFYQVETLVFGQAVQRATAPERFIIGADDPTSALPDAFALVLASFGCPILPMRYASAELAKIAINVCLVASVTVANQMAELSAAVGADWFEIIPALRLDRRIGAYAYLTPGLGLAGGNLERDLATVNRLADETGADVAVINRSVADSEYRRGWALRALTQYVFAKQPEPRLGVLGLTYKENTHSLKNSASIALLAALKRGGLAMERVQAWDPVVATANLGLGLLQASDALAAATGVDALLLMTPWPAFRELDPAQLAGRMRGNVILDPYRLLDATKTAAAGLSLITLGRAAEII